MKSDMTSLTSSLFVANGSIFSIMHSGSPKKMVLFDLTSTLHLLDIFNGCTVMRSMEKLSLFGERFFPKVVLPNKRKGRGETRR